MITKKNILGFSVNFLDTAIIHFGHITFKVGDMFSTFIKELTEDNDADIWAKAYNNRGHAKYMTVDFDKALQDYELALKTGFVTVNIT